MEFKIGALYKFNTEYFVVTGSKEEDEGWIVYLCTPTKFNKTVMPDYISSEFDERSKVGTESMFITDNKKVIDKFMKFL